MKNLLWLDDVRNPHENNWLVFSPIPLDELTEVIWVKSYNELVEHIIEWGVPDAVAFDHDLHFDHYGIKQEDWEEYYITEKDSSKYTGFNAAYFLIKYCEIHKCPLPLWNCQSANIVGKENINSLLNNFKKFQDESNNRILPSRG